MSAKARHAVTHYFAACGVEVDGPRPTDIYRMWRYYLSSVAAAFRARNADVWQALLTAA